MREPTFRGCVADCRYPASGICPVHHVGMRTEVVHGSDALNIMNTPNYAEAVGHKFPHGGIDYGPQSYGRERGKIYVCPLCEKAKVNYIQRRLANRQNPYG